MNRDRSNIAFVIVVGWLLLFLFVCYRVTSAQSPVATWFIPGCLEWVDDNTYRIHFGYSSDGVEEWVATFDFPPGTTPYISTPPTFTTVSGVHDDEWYLEADSTVTPLTYIVNFDNGYFTHIVYLSNWTAELCDFVEPAPAPLALPELHWAWNSGSGKMYSYVPVSNGIVPLPAAGE